MYKIAGELLPNVIHVSSRSVATHALSIFGDHSDVMATRATGYAMLASANVQEAQDLAAVAHIATLNSSVPFLHFFDGFRTSHEVNTITPLDLQKLAQIYPFDKVEELKQKSLNSSHPHQQGTSQNPDIFFQNREASNTHYANTPNIVQQAMDDLNKISGRKYHLFDYYGAKDAEHVVVLMGSGATTTKSTVEFLNKTHGTKYGVVVVRLFRPFSVKHFINALPKTVKSLAVLDRTKEAGSAGEPLYQDIVNAVFETDNAHIKVVGGRYGIGNKDFTPTMVQAVFNNLAQPKPKNHFTVGIEDDITHFSLDMPDPLIVCEGRMISCKFFGFGGDGTVSANKSSIKILSENSDLYGQAYFEYDSKKSGNTTITHMRYGKEPIEECYLLNNISFVGCHNQSYLNKFDILKDVKHGGTLLLNTNYDVAALERIMPNSLKQQIAQKQLSVYTIDAYKIAMQFGLNTKINLIMQTAFFKLNDIIPFDLAKQKIKEYAKAAYAKAGADFYDKNCKAIDATEQNLQHLSYPKSWKDLPVANTTPLTNNKYFNELIQPIQTLKGNSLPVSKFSADGRVPTDTSKLEKRNIATQLPCWIGENCIQCNLCSFVCPHAAIRTHLVSPDNLKDAPNELKTLTAVGEGDKQFVVQVSPMDCTGCGVCANVCPSKNKALEMVETLTIFEKERKLYEYLQTKPKEESIFGTNTVKGVGFKDPYFEFSGACAGCGETPYLKVLTQLFGDRMIMANATGCSSIYGGSEPTCPFTKDQDGNGVAWANSLFEDNAEFGLGIKLGANQKQNKLKLLLQQLFDKNMNPKLNEFITGYLQTTNPHEQRYFGKLITEILRLRNQSFPDKLLQQILALQDSFVTQSVWIVGGDGWAYDIGYGGLDHVLNSGQNLNILVLDTEVYSNTGGQASKATPIGAIAKFASGGKRTRKKDLGLLATLYKDVYVAQVSMGANPSQLLKVFNDAESYNGVSIILAYSPCIAHGIDMSKTQEEMKLATQTGYWNLWHYDPRLREQNKNPFVLDSPKPFKPVQDLLLRELRYKTLLEKDKETATKLFEQAQNDVNDKYEFYKKLSETEIL